MSILLTSNEIFKGNVDLMKKNFIGKSTLILSMLIFMLVLVGCSAESDMPDSDHGTAEELLEDPSCAAACHTEDVLYD